MASGTTGCHCHLGNTNSIEKKVKLRPSEIFLPGYFQQPIFTVKKFVLFPCPCLGSYHAPGKSHIIISTVRIIHSQNVEPLAVNSSTHKHTCLAAEGTGKPCRIVFSLQLTAAECVLHALWAEPLLSWVGYLLQYGANSHLPHAQHIMWQN